MFFDLLALIVSCHLSVFHCWWQLSYLWTVIFSYTYKCTITRLQLWSWTECGCTLYPNFIESCLNNSRSNILQYVKWYLSQTLSHWSIIVLKWQTCYLTGRAMCGVCGLCLRVPHQLQCHHGWRTWTRSSLHQAVHLTFDSLLQSWSSMQNG